MGSLFIYLFLSRFEWLCFKFVFYLITVHNNLKLLAGMWTITKRNDYYLCILFPCICCRMTYCKAKHFKTGTKLWSVDQLSVCKFNLMFSCSLFSKQWFIWGYIILSNVLDDAYVTGKGNELWIVPKCLLML